MMKMYGVQKVTWESTSVNMPKRSPTAVNTAMKAMPRMISGTMMGRMVSVSTSP